MSVAAGRLVLCAPSGAGNEVSKVAPPARTYPIRDAYFGTTPLLHQRAYVLCCRCSALCCNRTRREIGGSDEFGFETGTWVPARLLTMIRGAGPGRYLVITDGAGAVPVVGFGRNWLLFPGSHAAAGPAGRGRRFYSPVVSSSGDGGVSRLGSVARRRPRLETARGRAAGGG